ncbi:amino acid permease family protein [Streptococcus pneumoniae]|nr:amino acid permease family protein [Streptococcus pneumoniae]
MNIFRTKNVSLDKTEMHRHLKLWDLILLGIGAMVGTGVFTITGTAAATLAGPALVISIVISALCVGLSALFFAEFASRVPATGGAYSYLYAILGEFPAWLAGWLTMMEFMTAISGVASGWAAYFKGLLSQYGIAFPQALNGTFNPQAGTFVDLLPILVLVLVTSLVLLNAKAALRFNSILVILKFSALALFVLVGIWNIKFDNWSNFAPYGFGQIYGASTGIMAGASLMFFGFLGFESISMAVDEVKTPQKNIPRGIVLSLSIVTILYALVTLVLTGVVHYSHLNVDDAVAFALRSVGISWAANYVSLVAILTDNANKMLFSPLDNAKNGMKIYLTDKNKVYTYEIREVKRVTPDRVDEVDDRDGVNEITLVTCEDLAATERIIVKGDLKETKDYSQTSDEILTAFNQPYKQFY